MRIEHRGRIVDIRLEPTARHAYRVSIGETTVSIALHAARGVFREVSTNGVRARVAVLVDGNTLFLGLADADLVIRDATHDVRASA